jgi:hypothetical protein
MKPRILFAALVLAGLASGVLAFEQRRRAVSPPPDRSEKPENYSPLGFADLLAYEQAYPGEPGSALVAAANAAKYWVFQGVAVRGAGPGATGAWLSLGPETTLSSGDADETVSGRVSALLVSPTCSASSSSVGRCRLWVATAGGGIWRTDSALTTSDPKWRWIGHGLGTNNIGSLALDPADRTGNTIYVGTGETNQPNNSGAGTGVYRSTDGGDHWTRIPTLITDTAISPSPIDFTSTRGISAVVVDPRNAQTIYVATTSAMLGMTAVRGGQTQTTGGVQPRVGLYKTQNRGQSWMLIWTPPLEPIIPSNPSIGPGVGDTMFGVRHVKLDPRNSDIVYATAWNNAIHRSAPSLENGDASFKPVFAIVGGARFRDLAMFDLTVKNGHTRIYAYNGTDALAPQALYRLDNADVPAASLVTGGGPGVVNTAAWIKLSSDDSSEPGFTSRRLCSSQCFYDLVVAVPAGQPDHVVIGGVAIPAFGEPTLRSIDAGASFSGFGTDAQNPRNRSHVDVRAVAFHPGNPAIAWVGSDGGVVRNDGNYTNLSGQCLALFNNAAQCQTVLARVPTRLYFLNKGLQTMQFYNVAVDSQAPLTRLIGGLQDNSTIWTDGTTAPGVWKMLFPFGDGTSASGFHPTRSDVLFASFQSNNFFTNFRNGDPSFWVRTDGPFLTAGERESITQSTGRQFITFDTVRADTQFTAFQHVWRTQNNGGNQTALEANCRFPGTGARNPACGDWLPLGVAFPFPAGSTPASSSRKPGDLTSDFYGGDRTDGLVVAVERARADAGTLWAATNKGRLFISRNADASSASVTFTRIDTPATPGRFVTRIFADPFDPNVAFISYSGFNALTPATPGHVFRAVFNPATNSASFTSMDFDLGDLPINTIALDHIRGDLYAATDFGPLILRAGATTWQLAGVGFPEALMVDLEIIPERRILVAATHGLGIFYLNLK